MPKTEGGGAMLGYRILREMYLNSRVSALRLSKKLHSNYYTVSKTLKELERANGLAYTLELDVRELGFLGIRVLAIKFEKAPDLKLLRKELQDDVFIQGAYLTKGDFDLLIYAMAMDERQYIIWEWTLRSVLGRYEPQIFECTADKPVVGFFPLSTRTLRLAPDLKSGERDVISALNDNSRMRINELADMTGISQVQVPRIMRRLMKKGTIVGYRALVQKPEKKLTMAYFLRYRPGPRHREYQRAMTRKLAEESAEQTTSDYGIMCDTYGHEDSFFVCSFRDMDAYSRRGPSLWKDACRDERVAAKEAVITDVVMGKLPLHAGGYDSYIRFGKEIVTSPGEYAAIRRLMKEGKLDEVYRHYRNI